MTQRSSLFLALFSMIIMLVLYGLTAGGMMGDNPVGRTNTYEDPLIVPAPYAFAIWGLIYTGLIVFPIYQLIKKRDQNPLWHQIRIWYALNVIGNGLWLVFASYDWLWMSVGVIVFMLVSLYKINALLVQIKSTGGALTFLTERLVFSLYFAWITLATALNVSAALKFYQWDGFGISDVNWTLAILIVAAGIAGATAWKYRDIAYAGVVIWAFIALVIKHWVAYPILAYLSIGVVAVFLGSVIYFAVKPSGQQLSPG